MIMENGDDDDNRLVTGPPGGNIEWLSLTLRKDDAARWHGGSLVSCAFSVPFFLFLSFFLSFFKYCGATANGIALVVERWESEPGH